MRIANIYFLATAILQCIPAVSTFNPITGFVPIIFVIGLSMVREGIENYRRYVEDKKANSQPIRVLSAKYPIPRLDEKKTQTKLKLPDFDIDFPDCYDILESKDIKVGHIVLVYEDETFPADLILLGTSGQGGKAYIETTMLDGEKNLKKRTAEPRIAVCTDKRRFTFHGRVVCEKPTHALDHFGGTIFARDFKILLSENLLLMKGANLKNTKWVTGVVAFTGLQTKLLLNSNKERTKQSRIESIMNKLIIVILILQALVCIVVSIIQATWQVKNANNHFYISDGRSAGLTLILTFLSYFLLLGTFIPISLIVTLEIVKFVQLFFIQWDVSMYRNDRFAKVLSCTINEELGQLKYIFSDKTGTLTCNKMELKGIRVYNKCYGDKSLYLASDTNKQQRKPTIVNEDIEFSFNDPELTRILSDRQPEPAETLLRLTTKKGEIYDFLTEKDRVQEFLKLLACCHEVSGAKFDKDEFFTYSGQSPDEVCLVDAAQRIGVTFIDNRDRTLVLSLGAPNSEKKEVRVQLLEAFPFDSVRARMSVIIEDEKGDIKLYCKGSDEKIKSLLSNSEEEQSIDPILIGTNDYLSIAASKGFRTLCMAMKVIDKDEFAEWKERMHKVKVIVPCNEEEAKKKKEMYNVLVDEIEKNLSYLGCTVVEDKLQENVENTISSLEKAGIKVWMITGDKLETAKSIGYSCKMFTREDMNIIQIDESYHVPGSQVLDKDRILNKFVDNNTKRRRGLLITGMIFEKLINNKEVKDKIIKRVKECDSVICCRATANQKAVVVKAMKKACPTEVCLAIGDGANDVPMIHEAHVGVGIYGKEGMQAAQSSDYAIGEFQCLWNLLMIHGRLSYMRISELIMYFFYKNFVMTIPQLLFVFRSGYSAQTFYESWYVSLYNFAFTSIPLMVKALFEHDIHHIKDKELPLTRVYPCLYHLGQEHKIFNFLNIGIWLLYGIVHGTIAFFVPVIAFENSILTEEGTNEHMWIVSIASFTSVVIIVNLKLFITTRYITWINAAGILPLSIGLYTMAAWISNYMELFETNDCITQISRTPIFHSSIIATVLITFTIDYFIALLSLYIQPNASNFCRVWAKEHNELTAEENVLRFEELQRISSMARNEKSLIAFNNI
jgi:phospholipid-translocating P-type ATPase (flippase)